MLDPLPAGELPLYAACSQVGDPRRHEPGCVETCGLPAPAAQPSLLRE